MEPLLPIDELKNLKWAVSALVELFEPGTFNKEIARNASKGIQARIDWVVAQLEASNEGRTNRYDVVKS